MQHCAVPDSLACCGVRGIEQCLHLISQQIGNQSRVGFLEGDRQDPADLIKRRGLEIFKKAKNDFMAASRTLRVSGAFRRVSSRCSRKSRINRPSSCSKASAAGATLSRAAANSDNSWKLYA
jgi:predicted ThiF/HesA family dinucleotide-utilizing enzyme